VPIPSLANGGPPDSAAIPPPSFDQPPAQPAPRVLQGYAQQTDTPAPDVAMSPNGVDPTIQQVLDLSIQMRQAAENILQAAGRFSKASTDAMDVTKHNDVGIGVAFGAYFGWLAGNYRSIGTELKGLAAIRGGASEAKVIAPLVTEAAAEAPAMASQVAELVNDLQAEKPALGAGIQSNAGLPGMPELYNQDAVVYPWKWGQAQGDGTVCGAACAMRAAHVLGVDKDIFQVIDAMPGVKLEDILTNGVKNWQVKHALRALGLQARMNEGLANLYREVATNRQPVIAAMRSFNEYFDPATGKWVQPGLDHAIVVESTEIRNGVPGVNIYDPVGTFYWQPLKTFGRFFRGDYVTAYH
jgi:hypothetical protein